MDILLIWFGMLGAVVLLFLVAWGYLYIERKISESRRDERQVQADGKGLKFGFWVAIVYFFVVWIVISVVDVDMGIMKVLVLAGLMLSLVASQVAVLLTGAILPLSTYPLFVTFLCFLMTGVCLWNAFNYAQMARFGFVWTDLVFAATYCSYGVIQLVGWLRSRKKDE